MVADLFVVALTTQKNASAIPATLFAVLPFTLPKTQLKKIITF
jgi:hypothetical protein